MLKASGIITMITDFGDRDYFVGAVKGVILSINPEAKIVDITHNIAPGNIQEAAFTLLNCYSRFPEGTVHYCVVDPGVGSERSPLLVFNQKYYFIAPDNGVVYPAVKGTDYWAIDIYDMGERYLSRRVSSSFDGRDIFAPAAALLSRECNLDSLGELSREINVFELPLPKFRDLNLVGEVIHIDRFGNVISNITRREIRRLAKPCILIKGFRIDKEYEYYGQAPVGVPFYIQGSAGYIEISMRGHRADRFLKAKVGDEISLSGEADG